MKHKKGCLGTCLHSRGFYILLVDSFAVSTLFTPHANVYIYFLLISLAPRSFDEDPQGVVFSRPRLPNRSERKRNDRDKKFNELPVGG